MNPAYIQVAMPTATQNVLQTRDMKEKRDTPLALRVPEEFKNLVQSLANDTDSTQVDIVIFAVRDCVRRKAFDKYMKPKPTDNQSGQTAATGSGE